MIFGWVYICCSGYQPGQLFYALFFVHMCEYSEFALNGYRDRIAWNTGIARHENSEGERAEIFCVKFFIFFGVPVAPEGI